MAQVGVQAFRLFCLPHVTRVPLGFWDPFKRTLGDYIGPYELQSKLLKGEYIGDSIGEYIGGSLRGDTRSLDGGSYNIGPYKGYSKL